MVQIKKINVHSYTKAHSLYEAPVTKIIVHLARIRIWLIGVSSGDWALIRFFFICPILEARAEIICFLGEMKPRKITSEIF